MSLSGFRLEQALADLRHQGLYRQPRLIDQGVTPCIQIDGRQLINFSSNDYLGLARHPALTAAIQRYLQQAGHTVGAGASHLVCGHHQLHEQLATRLAQQAGYPAALLFSSGYQANVGVLSALLGRHDTVFQDRLNHASLLDGARLSGARLVRYGHLDMQQLQTLLQAQSSPDAPARRVLIATDQVFSMDGTEAPLAILQQLAASHDAALMIDDAHGFGLREQPLPAVDIYMATLGKAVGTYGAFVAGSPELIDYLRHAARSFAFTTATPPLLAAATLAALDILQQEPERRHHLTALIQQLRTGLQQQGWYLLDSASPIQPVLIGDNDTVLQLSACLQQQGCLVVAIRPPTVPAGTARLRISLSAAHTAAQVDQLLAAMASCAPRFIPLK